MTFDELKSKASSLPLSPGVYIMRDDEESVIYVGKAKKLKNRVSQYFQDTASHSPKTRLMVSKICSFDYIVAGSEFEALVLECSLIKQYMPKYNILLKDDKGYPYLRLNMKDKYPKITMVSKPENDGAEYFGPFGSRGLTQSIVEAIRLAFRLPGCNKQFPRDIGKNRPCLNYHMNQCAGWCQEEIPASHYRAVMEQARQLLLGNYKKVYNQIRQTMLQASDELNFELAAALRDRLSAVDSLGQKQLVASVTATDTDVIGFFQLDTKSCFTVLHFRKGNLIDKDFEILSANTEESEVVSALLTQYYLRKKFAPKTILLPCRVEQSDLIEQLFESEFGKKVTIKTPVRGDNVRLVEMARNNAQQEIERIMSREEKYLGALRLLSKTLSLDRLSRIESFDISNISGTDIVAAMVVFVDGKPKKCDYKHFKIRELLNQDDYASMKQALERRFSHYLNADAGFDVLPDLLLIDGGAGHVTVAKSVLDAMGIAVPMYGMVKDNRHRTRALISPEGEEISIEHHPALFSFIGNIQEETHRFAISYHRSLRSKKLKHSELDEIPGIGDVRKERLLKHFKSVSSIKNAEIDDLERILPKDAASAVYHHFKSKKKG